MNKGTVKWFNNQKDTDSSPTNREMMYSFTTQVLIWKVSNP